MCEDPGTHTEWLADLALEVAVGQERHVCAVVGWQDIGLTIGTMALVPSGVLSTRPLSGGFSADEWVTVAPCGNGFLVAGTDAEDPARLRIGVLDRQRGALRVERVFPVDRLSSVIQAGQSTGDVTWLLWAQQEDDLVNTELWISTFDPDGRELGRLRLDGRADSTPPVVRDTDDGVIVAWTSGVHEAGIRVAEVQLTRGLRLRGSVTLRPQAPTWSLSDLRPRGDRSAMCLWWESDTELDPEPRSRSGQLVDDAFMVAHVDFATGVATCLPRQEVEGAVTLDLVSAGNEPVVLVFAFVGDGDADGDMPCRPSGWRFRSGTWDRAELPLDDLCRDWWVLPHGDSSVLVWQDFSGTSLKCATESGGWDQVLELAPIENGSSATLCVSGEDLVIVQKSSDDGERVAHLHCVSLPATQT